MVLLSIITVVKNRSASIISTMYSLLSQKEDRVEYIVIDAASTDGTFERIEEHRSEIDIIISEPDKGIYDAINKGIRLASGKYIGLLHAGDTLLPGVIPRILDEIEKSNDEVLYGCAKYLSKPNGFFVLGLSADELLKKMIVHPASFVPKALYDKFGLYDDHYKIAADYDLFLRIYLAGAKFRFINIIVCNFSMDGISNTDPSAAKETDDIQIKYGLRKIIVSNNNGIKKRIYYGLRMVARALFGIK